MAAQPLQLSSPKRALIRGAAIITMDVQGDLPQGDILITDDTLTEIAPRRTNVRTVFDLLAYAEGKVTLTVDEPRE